MRNKLLVCAALLAISSSGASAQGVAIYGSTCGNCGYITSAGGVVTCCGVATPDDATLASWAAKKAVASQLDWFDEKKVERLDRSDLDSLQARVDEVCKWAKTLSNHIFAAAYAEWGMFATSKLEERRRSLDKLDVAKSLVTGLPTPPTK